MSIPIVHHLKIVDVEEDERDRLTDLLAAMINEAMAGEAVRASRVKPPAVKTQDAGSILEVTMNAAAITILARGIAEWLRGLNSVEIELVKPDGTTLKGKRFTPKTAEAVVRTTLESTDAVATVKEG